MGTLVVVVGPDASSVVEAQVRHDATSRCLAKDRTMDDRPKTEECSTVKNL
jgi:hypothetical protein